MGYNQGYAKQYVQVIIYYYTHRHGFCSKEGPVFFSDEYPTKSSSKGPLYAGNATLSWPWERIPEKKEKINK